MTFAGCGRLWSVREQRIPDDESLAACMEHVGYSEDPLDDRRAAVLLPDAGMRIGLGGIAKGYGVDRAADVLAARGISSFVVDGGGDLLIEGRDVEGPWTVHIAHPRQTDEVFDTIHAQPRVHRHLGRLPAVLRARRRPLPPHPRSGDGPSRARAPWRSPSSRRPRPRPTRLATGLFVLGPERGLAVAASLPGVSALYFAPDLSVSRVARISPRPAGRQPGPGPVARDPVGSI